MGLKNNKGQALLEMCAAMLPMGVLFGSMLFLLYFIWSYSWVQNQIYEATLCAVMQEPILECQNEFQTQIRKALVFGRIQQLQIVKQVGKYQGSCVFAFHPWFEMHLTKEVPYPISRSL